MTERTQRIPRRGRAIRRALLPLLAALLVVPATAIASEPSEFTYSQHWGGAGEIAHRHTANLCQDLRIEPGAGKGVSIWMTSVETSAGKDWYVAEPGHGRVVRGVLECAPLLEIWGHSAGPWDPEAPGGPGWLSIRCPYGGPVLSGAGYWTEAHPHVTQVAGGFGSGRDGYWHYRFHNWSGGHTRIQLWGVCVSARVAGL